MSLVVDGSITLAWCFVDESSDQARHVQALVARDGAVVPAHWHLEVANGLLMGKRRGRITPPNREASLGLLWSLRLEVDDRTQARAFADTFALAERHQLTIYDAAYLELALRRGLPLATLDSQLHHAAIAANVPVLIKST
jgi:predicted nucleic acid-binding protein